LGPDGHLVIRKAVIKIAQIDRVRENALAANGNIKIGINGVITAHHGLGADGQASFVGPDSVVVTDVDPTSQDDSAIAFTDAEFNAFAEKDKAGADDIAWSTVIELEKTCVANEVIPTPGPIANNPTHVGKSPRIELLHEHTVA